LLKCGRCLYRKKNDYCVWTGSTTCYPNQPACLKFEESCMWVKERMTTQELKTHEKMLKEVLGRTTKR